MNLIRVGGAIINLDQVVAIDNHGPLGLKFKMVSGNHYLFEGYEAEDARELLKACDIKCIEHPEPVTVDCAIDAGGADPAEIEVPRGSTVKWTNTDDEAVHSVVGDNYDSGRLAFNASAERVFPDRGEFLFYVDADTPRPIKVTVT